MATIGPYYVGHSPRDGTNVLAIIFTRRLRMIIQ